MTAPTPLLDFFKRGEVARDVRLLAAAGAIAPRAHEQLSILILLLDDSDREVRTTAQETLARIPVESLTTFLARSDVPIGVREFFADRGVFPAEMPSLSAEEPLLDVEAGEAPPPEEETAEDQSRESLIQQIANMSFTERLKAAMKGSREMRGILIRDPNKMISAAVLSSPKLNEAEIESFSKMTNVSDEVLRIIGTNRAWTKNYSVIFGLTKNPKTPLAISLNLMARLNDRDVSTLATDRNVPEPLRAAARRKVALGNR
ncbi:MAG TPA: hypothetical protein VF456_16490 [Vicinamibacterales bacterium]